MAERGQTAAGHQRGDGREKGRGGGGSMVSTALGIACTLPPHGPGPAGKDVPISISLFFFAGPNQPDSCCQPQSFRDCEMFSTKPCSWRRND